MRTTASKTSCLVILFLLISFSAKPYSFESGGIYYNFIYDFPTEVEVTYGSTKYTGNVIIPKIIEYSGKNYTVIKIGTSAFQNSPLLTSVTIPNSVKRIEQAAFNGCTGLTDVTLEDGDQEIYFADNVNNATIFKNCPLQTFYLGRQLSFQSQYSPFTNRTAPLNVTIGNNLESIRSYTFYNCKGLTSVSIPNTITSIESMVFQGCSELTSITIPNSVKSMGSSAFENCTKLNHVTISNNLTVIKYNTFYKCTELSSIIIPNSVTEIASEAFYGCEQLTSISIPNSVTKIGDDAFKNCKKLSSVVLEDGNSAIYFNHSINSVVFKNCPIQSLYLGRNISFDYDAPFKNQTTLTNVTISEAVTSIANKTFEGCTKITSIYSLAQTPPELGSYNFSKNNIYVPNGCGDIYRKTVNWKDNLIIDGSNPLISVQVKTAGTLASEILKQGVLPANLAKLQIGGTLNNTDWELLKLNTNSLYSLDLSGLTNTEIPASVFKGKWYLLSIVLPSALEKIGASAFEECRLDSCNLVLPETLKLIEASAFKNTRITSLNLPKNITAIGESAFRGCSSLAGAVNIPNRLTSIEPSLFSDCSQLESILLSSTVNTIKENAFNNCTLLKSINLPDNLASIKPNAFSNCMALESIEFPIALKEIGSSAFKECRGLQKIVVHKSQPISINENTFSGADYNNCKLCVPKNSAGNFLTAIGWKNFINLTEEATSEGYLFVVTSNQGGKVLTMDEEVDNTTIGWNIQPNKQITFTILPNNKYRIHEVLLNEKNITNDLVDNSYTLQQLTGDATLKITFEESYFTVTTAYNRERGSVLINDENVKTKIIKEGENVTFTMIPQRGYIIENVILGDDNITEQVINNELKIDKLNADLRLTVLFSLVTYSIATTYNNEEGRVFINGKESKLANLTNGEEVTFSIIPNDQYTIREVRLGYSNITDKFVNGIYTLPQVTKDLALTVTFEKEESVFVSLTLNCTEGGSLRRIIPKGNSVTYQIFPTENWVINTLSFNGTDVTSKITNHQYTTPALKESSILSVVFVKPDKPIESPLIVGKWKLITDNGQDVTHVTYNNNGTFKYTSLNEPDYEEQGTYKVENNKLYELFNGRETWVMKDIITLNSTILTLRELENDGVTYKGNPYTYQRENETGINTSTKNVIKVYAANNQVTIKGTHINTPILIYSTSGQMIHSCRSTENVTTIALPESGIYLIKIENNTYKVSL